MNDNIERLTKYREVKAELLSEESHLVIDILLQCVKDIEKLNKPKPIKKEIHKKVSREEPKKKGLFR